MKKIIILLLTIFLSNSISNATCWEQYSTKMFIDTDSIEYYVDDYGRTNPEQYTFWIKYLNVGSSLFTSYEKYTVTAMGISAKSDATLTNLFSYDQDFEIPLITDKSKI